MAYQKSVWSDPALNGFDELIDFRALAQVDVTTAGLQAVAHVAAGMDATAGPGRFAIVVNEGLEFGLSRMYEAFRELEGSAVRQVMIFQQLEEAHAWLDERPEPS